MQLLRADKVLDDALSISTMSWRLRGTQTDALRRACGLNAPSRRTPAAICGPVSLPAVRVTCRPAGTERVQLVGPALVAIPMAGPTDRAPSCFFITAAKMARELPDDRRHGLVDVTI